MRVCLSLLFLFLAMEALSAGESWTMSDLRTWAHEPKSMKLTPRKGGFEVRYAGKAGWCVDGFPRIAVTPGDVFEMSCRTEPLPDVPQSAPVAMSAVLRNADGAVLSWTFALRKARPGEKITSAFMVPAGVATVQPRVEGWDAAGARVRNVRVERKGNLLTKKAGLPACKFGNSVLQGTVEEGGFRIKDLRTGRTWKPADLKLPTAVMIGKKVGADGTACAEYLEQERMKRFRTSIKVEKDRPEIVVKVEAEGEMLSGFRYPAAFATQKGDRLIVPLNEGMGYPADEPDKLPERLIAYGGHGLCMAFFGVVDDATGAGWMAIIETPDDAAVELQRDTRSRLWTMGPEWESQKGRFGYVRRVRYVFQDKGGYVAMCKRYRDHVKKTGKFKPFSEKVKERPLVDRLIGAPNIWYWRKDKIRIAKELKAAGIDRFLWSSGGSVQDIRFIAGLDDVLVGRYDVYQDVFHPEQCKKLVACGWKNEYFHNTEAWPHDIIWNSANSNDWRRAWGIKAGDGTWTHCAMMCDSMAPVYARRHVAHDLKTRPYSARFVDTTVAAPWQTCWNPAHPMTRSDSRHWKMELLRLMGDEFNLVVGSEAGHDAAVPYCDYFEGMLTISPYQVPDAGRTMEQICTNVPPRVAKYQVGEAYRLPLWELVYHECVCAHWYWGDYNNKLPALWDKRDLFNILYGTMGMYCFDDGEWKKNKERFVRSYRMTSPIARATGYSEMLDHKILTPDRAVQQSRFADGTTVTVNFGSNAFKLPSGIILAPRGHHVRLGAPAARNF